MVHEIGGRTVGFIEYIPGEFAWRAIHAPGYLVIHCFWVVGKGKGKGYGSGSRRTLSGLEEGATMHRATKTIVSADIIHKGS